MDITLLQCHMAYTTLRALAFRPMDFSIAKELMKLIHRLAPYSEDYMAKGHKLGEEYAILNEDGTLKTDAKGEFVLKDPTKKEEFLARDRELSNLTVSEEFEKVTIQFPKNFSISPDALSALDPFIDFA